MKRVIFDTNIYGFLIKEKDSVRIKDTLIDQKEMLIYGHKIIRKELRDIPKKDLKSRKARIALLELYDDVIKKHLVKHDDVSNKLLQGYLVIGADYFKNDVNTKVDLLIVACASANNLDIVYSEDNKIFHSKEAYRIYKFVNEQNGFRTPRLMTYDDLLVALQCLDGPIVD